MCRAYPPGRDSWVVRQIEFSQTLVPSESGTLHIRQSTAWHHQACQQRQLVNQLDHFVVHSAVRDAMHAQGVQLHNTESAMHTHMCLLYLFQAGQHAEMPVLDVVRNGCRFHVQRLEVRQGMRYACQVDISSQKLRVLRDPWDWLIEKERGLGCSPAPPSESLLQKLRHGLQNDECQKWLVTRFLAFGLSTHARLGSKHAF